MLPEPKIIINQLSKTFTNSDEPAVKSVSLSIGENEIYGLLGPNGAGKTTTISILCGLFAPTSGSVSINGWSLSTDMDKIKQIVGVVPQDIALYPTLTAFENLEFYGTMYGVNRKELKLSILNWLEKLGLAEVAHKRVATFSGGMKRRINLIASILHKPSILILDEPTVGVDVHSRNVIIQQLEELNREQTTIIYTSHHMDEAQHFCTKVGIIDHGTIIAEGTPLALIEQHEGCTKLEDVFLKLTNRNIRESW